MATPSVSRRGVLIEVETVQSAELDLALLGLGDEFLEQAADALSRLPVSQQDSVQVPIRIRAFDEHDVAYMLSRSDDCIFVTILRIWPAEEREKMQEILSGLDMVAMLRGSMGI